MIHYLGTAVFVVLVVLNHKVGLQLTPTDLVILATVLGIHQITTLIRALKLPDVTAAEKSDV